MCTWTSIIESDDSINLKVCPVPMCSCSSLRRSQSICHAVSYHMNTRLEALHFAGKDQHYVTLDKSCFFKDCPARTLCRTVSCTAAFALRIQTSSFLLRNKAAVDEQYMSRVMTHPENGFSRP